MCIADIAREYRYLIIWRTVGPVYEEIREVDLRLGTIER